MGIKTQRVALVVSLTASLKNLPTTWGLRLREELSFARVVLSEKPPHHMGIKTFVHPWPQMRLHSEKPPHHSGIIQR